MATNALTSGYDATLEAVVHHVRTATGDVFRSYSASKASVDALGVTAADSARLGGHPAADYVREATIALSTTGTGTSLVAGNQGKF